MLYVDFPLFPFLTAGRKGVLSVSSDGDLIYWNKRRRANWTIIVFAITSVLQHHRWWVPDVINDSAIGRFSLHAYVVWRMNRPIWKMVKIPVQKLSRIRMNGEYNPGFTLTVMTTNPWFGFPRKRDNFRLSCCSRKLLHVITGERVRACQQCTWCMSKIWSSICKQCKHACFIVELPSWDYATSESNLVPRVFLAFEMVAEKEVSQDQQHGGHTIAWLSSKLTFENILPLKQWGGTN